MGGCAEFILMSLLLEVCWVYDEEFVLGTCEVVLLDVVRNFREW